MTVHYDTDGITLYAGDCLDILRQLPDASVDAVVTDPPYGLEFMGKAWDSFTEDSKARAGMSRTGYTDGAERIERPSHMGGLNPKCRTCGLWQRGGNPCTCDTPDFPNERRARSAAFGDWCEQWATECLRVLKPGGHMLAFGGTRTWHRLACAIEDAEFEIRDSIAWLYGSGFPKSLDVSKAIDKRRTEDRAPVDAVRSWLNDRRIDAGYSHDAVNKHFGHASNGGGSSSAWMTNPTSKSLPTWDQWQELKRLFGFGDDYDAEVWRLNGRKGAPGDAWDARAVVGSKQAGMGSGRTFGMLQSEGFNSERETLVDVTAPATNDARRWQGWGTALKPAFEPVVVARKPLRGTVAANVLAYGTGALNIDGCRIGTEDALSFGSRAIGTTSGIYGTQEPKGEGAQHAAGRWPANVVLDDTTAAILDEQSGTLTSGNRKAGGYELMGYMGADVSPMPEINGDSGGASRFFYTAKAPGTERVKLNGTAHPTVKPLDLMRWLVRLVTPPGGTVLDPFAGSGTTVEACLLEGFRCVAIERETDYLPLIMQRIHRRLDPVAAVEQLGLDGGLFDLLEEGA